MIRVCEKGHITGTKICHCGAKADQPLGGRMRPVWLHPKSKGASRLRQYRRSGVWPKED